MRRLLVAFAALLFSASVAHAQFDGAPDSRPRSTGLVRSQGAPLYTTGLWDLKAGVTDPSRCINVNLSSSNGSVVWNYPRAFTIKAGGSAPSTPTLFGIACPAPTPPYTETACFEVNFNSVKFSGPSVGYYDPSTGKLRVLTATTTPQYSFATWNSATSRASASEPSTPRAPTGGNYCLAVADSGTVVSWSVSYDSATYSALPNFTETKSGGFLASYGTLFFGFFNDCESGSDGCTANDNLSVTYVLTDPNGAGRLAGP